MDEKGESMTELLMVMTLLIFFGISMYLIIYSGSSVVQRIDNEKDEQIEARTALSFINVRIRQVDAEDSVIAARNSLNGGDAILLQNRDPGNPDLDYDTWIYWDNGNLLEVLANAGEVPQWDAANTIARIDGLTAVQQDGFITSSVHYTYNDERKTISSSIRLRSRHTGWLTA